MEVRRLGSSATGEGGRECLAPVLQRLAQRAAGKRRVSEAIEQSRALAFLGLPLAQQPECASIVGLGLLIGEKACPRSPAKIVDGLGSLLAPGVVLGQVLQHLLGAVGGEVLQGRAGPAWSSARDLRSKL